MRLWGLDVAHGLWESQAFTLQRLSPSENRLRVPELEFQKADYSIFKIMSSNWKFSHNVDTELEKGSENLHKCSTER